MALLEKQLEVKESTIPGAGKGLFTKNFIPKGTRIIEYRGKKTTWKDADHREGSNAYLYCIDLKHTIDALTWPKSLARYINDAKGLGKVKGISNNCEFVDVGFRAFVDATKDIPAGAEILVGYGKEYWDVIKANIKIDKLAKKKKKGS